MGYNFCIWNIYISILYIENIRRVTLYFLKKTIRVFKNIEKTITNNTCTRYFNLSIHAFDSSYLLLNHSIHSIRLRSSFNHSIHSIRFRSSLIHVQCKLFLYLPFWHLSFVSIAVDIISIQMVLNMHAGTPFIKKVFYKVFLKLLKPYDFNCHGTPYL